jgi:hypothetical protein
VSAKELAEGVCETCADKGLTAERKEIKEVDEVEEVKEKGTLAIMA